MPNPYAAFHLPEFRYLLTSSLLDSLASRALAVVIAYQIYELTQSPLALGWLGLVEAIPAISLALFGGYVADRTDRRRVVLLTSGCAVALALVSLDLSGGPLAGNIALGLVGRFGHAVGGGHYGATGTQAEGVEPRALSAPGDGVEDRGQRRSKSFHCPLSSAL